jgi:hypothetical protein
MDIQVQEVYKTLNHLDQRRNTLGHITITRVNIQNKERMLKGAKKKRQVTQKANPLE